MAAALNKRLPLRSFFLIPAFLFIHCAPKATTTPTVEPLPERAVRVFHGDTLVYTIAFTDTAERGRFVASFNRFLKGNAFPAERYDSGGVVTVLKILPSTVHPIAEKMPVIEQLPVVDTALPSGKPSGEPQRGGSLRLYYPRGSIDYPLADLVEAYPFRERKNNDSLSGYFTVEQSSAAVTLTLAQKTINGAGKTMNALDLIEMWTRHIREHPAEGLASFRFCEGIMEYLHGNEAIVRGLTAVDNTALRIRLSAADPHALDRLRSRRLLPASFNLGGYTLTAVRGSDRVLAANKAAADVNPFVNEAVVRCGGDANPLLSFSLGRYDAVLLWSAPDIDYSRRNLLKNGWCARVGSDRYFIACTLQDSAVRAFIRSSVSGQELLSDFVKAEGAPVTALENDSAPSASQPPAAAVPLTYGTKEQLRILFRKDDAVSTIVAERLLAAVTHAGVTAALTAADGKSYETALVDRSYACAVGWVPETVLADTSEKLRLAAIFFSDEADEGKRVRENWEIPLFSIDWYLLAKNKVGLYKGKLSGIYVKQEVK
jgi:hypothetical protein